MGELLLQPASLRVEICHVERRKVWSYESSQNSTSVGDRFVDQSLVSGLVTDVE